MRAANGSAFLSVRRLVFSRCPRDQNLTPLSHSQDADSQFETRCLIVKTDPPQLLNETRPIRGNRLGPPHNLVNLHIDAQIRMLHKRPCGTLSCDNSLFPFQCVGFLDQIQAQSSERRAKGSVRSSNRQPNTELCLLAQAGAGTPLPIRWRRSICIAKFHGRPRSARASQHKRRLEAGRWQSPFKSQPLHIYGEIAGRDPIALSTVVKK